mgnify:CR=1 FL=1
MINLLSIEDRKAVRAEYRHRLFVVGGLLTLGLILIALIILSSFAFILSLRRSEVEGQIETIRKEFAVAELDQAREVIKQTNNSVKIFTATSSQAAISAVWGDLITARTPGIRLTRLSFSPPSKDGGQVVVEGKSETRATLLAYLDKLRQVEYFSEVDSPIKNIIQERDLTFTLTAILKK